MLGKLKDIIKYIGDDPDREGLQETPKRMLKSYEELFSGYKKNPKNVFKTFSKESSNEMIILKNIDFYSTCEHHFLPFFGKISIGYIPNKKIIGISKLVRLIDIYSKRLQIQERLVKNIADDLVSFLDVKGCIVICEAEHLCMKMRGVKNYNSKMITSAIRGNFKENIIRQEFLNLL